MIRWLRVRKRGKFGIDQRGSAAVEFAFLLLPITLILFGILEWGRFMYYRNTIQFGCEQAARYGVMRISAANAAADIKAYAQSQMTGVTLPSGQPVVTIDATTNTVEVETVYQFNFLVSLVAPASITIVGRAKM